MGTAPGDNFEYLAASRLTIGRKKGALVAALALKKRIDGRLIVGVGLVIAGMVGTVWLVWSMDTTVPYLQVTRDISEGEVVSQEDLSVVDLHVRDSSLPYLPGSSREEVVGLVATQRLSAGSLVPDSALTSALASDATTVTVSLDIGGTPWLVPGARVDVWVSPLFPSGSFGPPRVVSPAAVVAGVRSDEGFAVDPRVVHVDIRVAYRDVARVVDALAHDHPIYLTPVLVRGA